MLSNNTHPFFIPNYNILIINLLPIVINHSKGRLKKWI